LKKKILIAADCKVDSTFVEILGKELGAIIEIFYIDSTGKKRVRKIIRHVTYFLLAIKAFFYRRKYEHIIFWQQCIGIYYALLIRVFLVKKIYPRSLVLYLMYNRKKGILGRIQRFLYFSTLDSNALSYFTCGSAQEREFYLNELGREFGCKLYFVKNGIRKPEGYSETVTNNSSSYSCNSYFFAGGSSNRDFRTVIKAFEKLNAHLIIVCLPGDVDGIHIPSNVEVIFNVSENDFSDYMKKAYAVIIPIENLNVSSGILTLLQAMIFGKAIIATRSSTVGDYIDDTCGILIKDHSVEDIRNAVLEVMSNEQRLSSIAMNARLRYESEFTIEKYGERIGRILKEN